MHKQNHHSICTIIKLMLRLYDPSSGIILYNGKDIRDYNLKAYRDVFASTFQDFQIFGTSVKENILMGRKYNNEDEIVISALKKAGVYEKVMSLNNGINTIIFVFTYLTSVYLFRHP